MLSRTLLHYHPKCTIYDTANQQDITSLPSYVHHLWHCHSAGPYFITILSAPSMTLPLNRTLVSLPPMILPLTKLLSRSVLHSPYMCIIHYHMQWITSKLLHSHPLLDYYFIPIFHYHRGYWTLCNPSTDQYFIPYRCVLSITTQIGLPAKFDTLAIVSNFWPESYNISHLSITFRIPNSSRKYSCIHEIYKIFYCLLTQTMEA